MPEPDHFHANLQRGALLLNQDRPKEALPYIQAAIAANPDAPQGYAELARYYNAIPAQRGKSIAAINRAIGLAPNVSYYYGLKGWYLVCGLQYHAAFRTALQGLAVDPTCPQSLNALANAHTKLGQWKQAEAACCRILMQNPHDAPGLNLLAQALRHQRRWKETREIVARLLANMPNNSFGHANAGYTALAAGDHLRANEHFLESLRMNPHFDLARRGLLSSLRARIWLVRLNRRILVAINQPPTPRNLIFAFLLFNGALFTVAGITYAVSYISENAAAAFLIYLVSGLLLYVYLFAAVMLLGNFLLLFDPLGRHALTNREKGNAYVPMVLFAIVLIVMFCNGMWGYALGLLVLLLFLALTIQAPLWYDRRQRRRVNEASD